jgi:hypothetical protein
MVAMIGGTGDDDPTALNGHREADAHPEHAILNDAQLLTARPPRGLETRLTGPGPEPAVHLHESKLPSRSGSLTPAALPGDGIDTSGSGSVARHP